MFTHICVFVALFVGQITPEASSKAAVQKSAKDELLQEVNDSLKVKGGIDSLHKLQSDIEGQIAHMQKLFDKNQIRIKDLREEEMVLEASLLYTNKNIWILLFLHSFPGVWLVWICAYNGLSYFGRIFPQSLLARELRVSALLDKNVTSFLGRCCEGEQEVADRLSLLSWHFKEIEGVLGEIVKVLPAEKKPVHQLLSWCKQVRVKLVSIGFIPISPLQSQCTEIGRKQKEVVEKENLLKTQAEAAYNDVTKLVREGIEKGLAQIDKANLESARVAREASSQMEAERKRFLDESREFHNTRANLRRRVTEAEEKEVALIERERQASSALVVAESKLQEAQKLQGKHDGELARLKSLRSEIDIALELTGNTLVQFCYDNPAVGVEIFQKAATLPMFPKGVAKK